MAKTERTHTFKFVKSSDFKTTIVNGVFGGMNARGQLNMNFFIETIEMPKSITHNVKPGGVIDEHFIPNPPINKIQTESTRELVSGIVIDIAVAKSFIQWMKRHIDDHESKVKLAESEKKSDSSTDTSTTN